VEAGFAVWITGLPASGKSTVSSALEKELASLGENVAVLESDELRKVFTPNPRYDNDERDTFYGAVAHVGRILTEHGVSVIFDATANRRAYRDRARREIARYLEVFVDCPLAVCMARDPKGIYRRGKEGSAAGVPGLQVDYEPPPAPDVVVQGETEAPAAAARRIVRKLIEKGYVKE
jgi:adenylylsulfate kinase